MLLLACQQDLGSRWCTKYSRFVLRDYSKANLHRKHRWSDHRCFLCKLAFVIISPLVSLMYDQVAQLSSKNVRALCISGDQDAPLESSAAPEIRSDAYTAVEGRVGTQKRKSDPIGM